MVRIRLQRLGRRNRTTFRIVVSDARVKRQGMYLENLGHYDPVEEKLEKKLTIDNERLQYWIKQGAQPSEAVANLLKLKSDAAKAPEAAKAT